MTSENKTQIQEQQQIFGADDFVFTNQVNKDGKSEFVGGGYKVESFLLNNNMAPMTTINNIQQQDDDNQQEGGKKVSSPFENLAVPAGLFFINQRATKKSDNYDNDKKKHKDDFNHYKPHETASDDLMDKLFGLVEVDKKRKRKTKKHLGKVSNKKTRVKR